MSTRKLEFDYRPIIYHACLKMAPSVLLSIRFNDAQRGSFHVRPFASSGRLCWCISKLLRYMAGCSYTANLEVLWYKIRSMST